jgi:hypothetical protein
MPLNDAILAVKNMNRLQHGENNPVLLILILTGKKAAKAIILSHVHIRNTDFSIMSSIPVTEKPFFQCEIPVPIGRTVRRK